jgi:tetratricopeptide (TPR) repeat protein
MEKHDGANEAYSKALEIDPFNAYAWYAKKDFLRELGLLNESEEAFHKSLEIDLLDAEAWTSKSDALSGLGRNDESNFACNVRVQFLLIFSKISFKIHFDQKN